MGFLGVSRALYDYAPQADGELAIQEGDLLYILEKNSDDGWWKAKKRAGAEDEEEPIGLVPNNYIQEAEPMRNARAIYEYTRQTDEELSFPEDAVLRIFDTSDPDWILAGVDGDYGFVPSNYVDMQATATNDRASSISPPTLPTRPHPGADLTVPDELAQSISSLPTHASAIASVIQSRMIESDPPSQLHHEQSPYDEPRLSEEEAEQSPALPSRPNSQFQPSHSAVSDLSIEKDNGDDLATTRQLSTGGFHMYNINEMVSVMGKRKKMPTTLGINLVTGMILIAPEKAQDDAPQEWTAEKMTHYSREGKHVFMELVRPSKSVDFHAGAKGTAEEIVAALGELAGAARAEGLREVIMAGSQKRQKKGVVLYDFMAQGEDEVTVAAGDNVIIIDDSRSEEWWQVRRLKNGKEGVVPGSYIELTGTITPPLGQTTPISKIGQNSAISSVEQNRLEEIRLTKDAIKASKDSQQVGPGMLLPERGSSLTARDEGNNLGKQRNRRDIGRIDDGSKAKSKPETSKVRTWTDRSKSFSVEAQFLGLKDGKIHLHKLNGVKIAVPIAKMSLGDVEYVENLTGISLDDERPLADVRRSRPTNERSPTVGASIENRRNRPEYDWFQFFLSCDVAVGLCERYAQAFTRDSMDESVLPDVDANVLRNLGLREGDIIKVMRNLDTRFGRDRVKVNSDNETSSGSLFTGPSGTLRNNTRKSRPAPAVQTSDVVDAAALSARDPPGNKDVGPKSPTSPDPGQSPKPQTFGFEDDAWHVKPTKQEQQQHAPGDVKPILSAGPLLKTSIASAAITESMKDLSMLTAPLQPSKGEPSQVISHESGNSPNGEKEASTLPLSQQLPGASPSFFSTVRQPQQVTNSAEPQSATPHNPHTSPKSLGRQRPVPASMSPPIQGSLVPPPPQRPFSAPQSGVQQGVYAPPTLTSQMTGSVQGQVAPPGHSLNDLTQVRLQPQYTAQLSNMQPALTGFVGTQTQGVPPFPTGSPSQFLQPMMTGTLNIGSLANSNGAGHYSAMQNQLVGTHLPFNQLPLGQSSSGNINNYLPPSLEPQRTGMSNFHAQQTTPSAFGPLIQAQPLVPQQTGPPPPVRFGVTLEAKLTPQPTGRRANLAHATPQNPFGF